MKNLTTFTKDTVDVERLAQVIEEEGQPVHINVLARRAVQAFFETHGERLYAPGATYVVGEEIQLDGQPAVVRAVRAGSNKKQGIFTVLTLRLADGSERWMAADVAGASVQDREVVSEDHARQVVNGKDGARIRAVVGSALDQDARFVWFQDAQGNQWCLTKLLPEVGDAELTKVAGVLPGGLVNGEPHTESTEALVQTVWKIANDGSDTYELAAFALGRALAACGDVVEAGGQWMRSKAWDEFTRREQLTGPRMPTDIELPPGVEKATSGERAGKEDKQVDGDDSLPKATDAKGDLETWLADHPGAGVFTLTAQHYYRAWLPLSKDIRGLFPPLVAGRQQVTLRLNLVGYQENLNAWVDLREGRIWGGKGLYEALRAQKVYPGAKLRLLHVAGGVYELATRMVNKAEPVRVWRIWLEDGEVKGEEYQEKRRYDVEDQVFVADARFEDRAALLQQAEEAGNSIFGLMYKRAVIWWEALDRKELRVAVKQLFDDIHFDEKGRMTSPATIAWELWRRLAFEPVGNGLYRFRPEYGEGLKPAAVWGVTTAKPPVKESSAERRIVQTRRLPPPPGKGPGVPGEGTGPAVKKPLVESALWDEVRGDPVEWGKLEAAVEAYMADPAREGVLFIRGKAHECIRALLAKDRLDKLTVEEFNRQVWQIGKVTYRGASGWVDAPAMRAQLAGVSTQQLAADYKAGQLTFEGNQTWGSGSNVWGAALDEEYRTDEAFLRENLRYLLYSNASSLETRLGDMVKASNGFGMNAGTGILHTMWPKEEVLYNGRSVAALQMLGVTWNEGWNGDTAPYVRYRDFCRRMKEELGFESLTDVDWFMYGLGSGQFDIDAYDTAQSAALALIEKLGQVAVIQRYPVGRMPHTYIANGKTVLLVKFSRHHPDRGYYFFGLNQGLFWTISGDHADCYLMAICGDSDHTLVIPWQVLAEIGQGVTAGDQLGYWKVEIFEEAGHYELYLVGSGKGRYNCDSFLNRFEVLADHSKVIRYKKQDLLERDQMYLLGLVVARGVFANADVRVSLQASELEVDAGHLGQTAISQSVEVLDQRLRSAFDKAISIVRTEGGVDLTIYRNSKVGEWVSAAHVGHGSLVIPEEVFEAPRELQVEFVRGFADAAGYVRRAQYYMDGRIFVFFQIRQSDWLVPTALCRLLQVALDIPVSFVVWGHPNIRDAYSKAQSGNWAKEHQLKVFCDAFEPVGFYLPYKQKAFVELVKINKNIGRPLPALCDPGKKQLPTKHKPQHPDEHSERLPAHIRGVHCDVWWQVCIEMGCPFASSAPRQAGLW